MADHRWRGSQSRTIWSQTLTPLKEELRQSGILSCSQILSAVESLASQPNSSAVKDVELSEDLAFLAQQLNSLKMQNQSNGRGEVLYCRLLASTLQGKMVLMQPAAASIVCSTLRQWSDAASSSSSSPYDSLEVESGDRQLQVESLLALSSLLKDNLGSISGHERIATLVLLQSLASGHDSSSPPPSPSKPLRRTRRVDQAPSEVQRQALLALATCIPQRSSHLPTQPSSSSSSSQGRTAGGAGGGTLSPDQIQESLSCIITALTSVTSTFTNPPPSLSPSSSSLSATESLAHSKFLTTLLRTLNLFVMESKKGWVAHAGAIVTGLKALMLFGAGPNTSASSPLPSALPLDPFSQGSGLKSKYTPPHLRGASSSSTQPQPSPSQSRGSSRRVSAVNSDEGDWRAPSAHDHAGSTLDPAIEDRFKSSRVRLALLQILQSMAKSDSKAMHQFWSALLPSSSVPIISHTSPNQPQTITSGEGYSSSSTTSAPPPHNLATMLLLDPNPKVRSMAAATISCLLEGPAQRTFLAMAESPLKPSSSSSTLRSGFMTVSLTLGQITVILHRSLLHSAIHELSTGVVQVSLRALCVLMAGSPYERLSPGLMQEVMEGLIQCWGKLKMQRPSSAAHPSPSPSLLNLSLANQDGASMPPSDPVSIQSACLACMAEGLCTKQPLPALLDHFNKAMIQSQMALQGEARKEEGGRPSLPPLDLARELLDLCSSRHPLIRIEALAALRGLASNYPTALFGDSLNEQVVSCSYVTKADDGSLVEVTRDGSCMDGSCMDVDCCWSRVLLAARASLVKSGPPPSSPSSKSHPLPSSSSPSPSSSTAAATAQGEGSSNSSASTSPEDKAAQHAIQLIGAALGAGASIIGLLPPSPSAWGVDEDTEPGPAISLPPHPITSSKGGTRHTSGPAHQSHRSRSTATPSDKGSMVIQTPLSSEVFNLAVMWLMGFREALVPLATSHPSYMVRSAAVSVFSSLPEAVGSLLPLSVKKTLLLDLLASPSPKTGNEGHSSQPSPSSALMDPTAAVRASAFKSLGALSQQEWAFSPLSSFSPSSVDDPPSPPSILSAAASLTYGLADSVLSVRISASWALGSLCETLGTRWSKTRDEANHESSSSSGDCEMPRELIERAAEGCLLAMQDVDKVRSNGARGLGVLLSFVREARGAPLMDPSSPPPLQSPLTSLTSLLDKSLPGLQSCLTTGSMKVQWSACLAAQGLLTNPELKAVPLPLTLVTRVTPLLLILVMLVRDCRNFKIRTHAAAALAASSSRGVYGDMFADAILVVLGAIDSTTNKLVGGESVSNVDRSEDVGPGIKPFPNYRYIAGLSSQLNSTLLHLLSLAEASDATRLKEPLLTKKAEVLIKALSSEAEERLNEGMMSFDEPFSSSTLPTASTIEGGSREARNVSPRLPLDPFEEGKGEGAHSPSSIALTPLSKIKAMASSYAVHSSKVPLPDQKEVMSLVRGLRGLERVIQGVQKPGGGKMTSSGGMSALNELVSIASIIDQ